MPIPLLALAAAGSALQGFGTIAAGYQSAKANKASALGAKIESDMAKLRNVQVAEESRMQLATVLGNIGAIRTGRAVSGDSATGRAIERRTMADAYRAEGVARLGEMNRAGNADQAARGYRSAARWAIPMALTQAAGQFASAASYGDAYMKGRG